ncbi:ABC transporter permease [Hoyosella altamirensis]|uniref:ABC-2 type transport system permease protein n=1 Tax=Hoyosella altamirensis TaxID=616997 RepID=A0A839RTS6_9ACTN|nr:hypothetical protein [Hoyosella altamirensis]MBB3039759.1 ABC-2 type transport system permease protein [Hoyosella altamirensis]
MRESCTGTRELVRLMMRRDRLVLPWWVLALTMLPVLQAYGTPNLFPTDAQLRSYAATLQTPAFVALYGPVFEANPGSLALTRSGIAPVIVALIAALIVIRHTRTEEESGRTELLATTVVGRYAGLAAALITVSIGLALMGTLLTVGMLAVGLPLAGSIAVGASYAGAGLMFAAVGAVAAQLTASAGGARAIASAALGFAFAVRLSGDVSDATGGSLGWLSFLSPIGWVHQARPYAGEQWWVFIPITAFAVTLTAVAVTIAGRRDSGAGVLPSPLGPPAAGRALSWPEGVAWRLHRGAFFGWAAGFVLLGFVLGSAGRGIESLLADNPALQQALERLGGTQTVVDAYFSGIMGFLGLLASGYAIAGVLKLRGEETSLRAELMLNAPVSRIRWALGHIGISLIGAVVLLLLGGSAMGLAHGISVGDISGQVPRLAGASLVQVAAVVVLAAIAVAAFGLVPRFAYSVSWTALAAVFLIGQVGAVLELGQWALNVSPFTHLPRLPGGAVEGLPLLVLAVLAFSVTAAGLAAWRRRDVTGVG